MTTSRQASFAFSIKISASLAAPELLLPRLYFAICSCDPNEIAPFKKTLATCARVKQASIVAASALESPPNPNRLEADARPLASLDQAMVAQLMRATLVSIGAEDAVTLCFSKSGPRITVTNKDIAPRRRVSWAVATDAKVLCNVMAHKHAPFRYKSFNVPRSHCAGIAVPISFP
jgi:hypothetical protein